MVKHCKPEWQALQQAVLRGDTHAAAAAHMLFNAAKRRAKRACDHAWHTRLMHDLRHNPRRFLTAFKQRASTGALDDPAGFDAYCNPQPPGPAGLGVALHFASTTSSSGCSMRRCQVRFSACWTFPAAYKPLQALACQDLQLAYPS